MSKKKRHSGKNRQSNPQPSNLTNTQTPSQTPESGDNPQTKARVWTIVDSVLEDDPLPSQSWIQDVKRLYRDFVSPMRGMLALAIIFTIPWVMQLYLFNELGRWMLDTVLEVNDQDKNSEVIATIESTPPADTDPASKPATEIITPNWPDELNAPIDSAVDPPQSDSPDIPAVIPRFSADKLDKKLGQVWIYLVLGMSIWVLWLVSSGIRSWALNRIGLRITYTFRAKLYQKLSTLHLGYYEKTPTGKIMARVLDDVNVIQDWTTNQWLGYVMAAAALIIGISYSIWLNWKLALIGLIAIPFYAGAFMVIRPSLKRLHLAMRRLNSSLYARIEERLAAIGVVQSNCREVFEHGQMAKIENNSVRVKTHQILLSECMAVAVVFISATNTFLLWYLGYKYIRAGTLTPGALFAITSSMFHIYTMVNNVTNYAAGIQGYLVVLRRVFALLDEHVDVIPGPVQLQSARGDIIFDQITFNYPQQSTAALRDFNLHIKEGERIALIGPSGAGKSTVFQLLLRFYDPQKGRILVAGVDLTKADPRSLRGRIALVQQEPTVFSGSIAENIAYGRSTYRQFGSDERHVYDRPTDIMRAARQAEIHDFIMSLPSKYETEVGEKGLSLSGGQRQRIALAQALLTDPEVLLLDDTTSALDAITESRIRATLNRVMAGRTSLIITQRIATAQSCDRIIVMRGGVIEMQGTHAELAAVPGFYRDICKQQGVE